MPASGRFTRSTRPPRVQFRRSGQRMEIVIEGTVAILVLGFLALIYTSATFLR
jgi:hypothetical protein